MGERPVPLPPELEDVPPRPLEVKKERAVQLLGLQTDGGSSPRTKAIPISFSRRRATPLTPSPSPLSAPSAGNAMRSTAGRGETMRIRSRIALERSGISVLQIRRRSFFSLLSVQLTFLLSPLPLLLSLSLSNTTANHQDYVRARLVQFAGAFAARACPQLGAADVRAAAAAAIARLPPPLLGEGRGAGGASGAGDGPMELQLDYRHDCL